MSDFGPPWLGSRLEQLSTKHGLEPDELQHLKEVFRWLTSAGTTKANALQYYDDTCLNELGFRSDDIGKVSRRVREQQPAHAGTPSSTGGRMSCSDGAPSMQALVSTIITHNGVMIESLKKIDLKFRESSRESCRESCLEEDSTMQQRITDQKSNDIALAVAVVTVRKIFERAVHDNISQFTTLREDDREFLEEVGVMDEMASRALEVSRANGKPRPICAVVTGVGRGKTHFLHALAKKLNERSDTVAIALSFTTSPHPFGINKLSTVSNVAEALLFVAAHIVCAISQSIRDISGAMNILRDTVLEAAVLYKARISKLDYAFASNLLRELVSMIAQHYRHKPEAGNLKFVLVLDEVLQGVDHFSVDIPSLLSNAIVSDRSSTPLMKDVDGFLVMSALDVDAMGAARSDRKIIPLAVPSHLDAEKVVRWWLPVKDTSWGNIYDTNILVARTMELLISTMVHLPRAVEAMIRRANEQGREAFESGLSIGSNGARAFFQSATDLIRSFDFAFEGSYMPVSVAYGLVFQKEVHLDDTIMSLITDSVLTNVLSRFSKGVLFVPETGVWNLWMLVRYNSRHPFLQPVVRLIDGLLTHLDQGKADADYFLEIVAREVVNLHLCVAAASPSPDCNIRLQQLLHVENEPDASCKDNLTDFLAQFGTVSFAGMANSVRFASERFTLPNSYEAGVSLFLREANSVKLSQGVNAAEVALSGGEAASGLWLLRSTMGVIALFVDAKCSQVDMVTTAGRRARPSSGAATAVAFEATEASITDNDRLAESLTSEWKQAAHVSDVANEAARQSDWAEGSLAEALSKNRYLFVYLSTHGELSSVVKSKSNALIVGPDVVYGMLGVFKEVYASARRFSISADNRCA